MFRGYELFGEEFPKLLPYIPVTILYFMVPTLLSVLLGPLLCAGKMSRNRVFKYLSSVIVSFFRGTPGLVQIYLVFFGLPKLLDAVGVDAYWWNAGVFYIIATTLNFSSFVSEALKSAYIAIDKGQLDAGKAIGYSGFQSFFRIIVPQTLQHAIPNLKNLEIDLLKGTAVAYVIGVTDVMGKANKIIAVHRGYGQIWILLGAAIVYFVLSTVLEILFNWADKYMNRHERSIV